jgi:glycerol uptake operon antiterminator
MHAFIETISDSPVIATAQDKDKLSCALKIGVPTVFLVNTDIFSAKEYVSMAAAAGCNVFLHMDLIEGLAGNTKAVDYVRNRISPSGIISTKSVLIKYAREQGMFCIQRFFMVDSASYENAINTIKTTKPSMVELMPGILPDVIRRFTNAVDTPVIAGGLITRKQQIIEALSGGALGVSTGCIDLWKEA